MKLDYYFKSLGISKKLSGNDESYEASLIASSVSSQYNSITYVDSNNPINDNQRDFIKEILITNDDGKNWSRILTKDKTKCDSNNCLNIVDSLQELKNQFKPRKSHSIIFAPQSNKNKIMKSLDDFFDSSDYYFCLRFEESIKLQYEHYIKICLKIFNEKIIELDIDPLTELVVSIKNKIHQLEGIDIKNQSLIFDGKIIVQSDLDYSSSLGR